MHFKIIPRQSNHTSCKGTKTVMIVKKNNTYEIRSKKGKLLGKFLTKKAALKRLRQIEFFKNKK
jgi:hypothetical protein